MKYICINIVLFDNHFKNVTKIKINQTLYTNSVSLVSMGWGEGVGWGDAAIKNRKSVIFNILPYINIIFTASVNSNSIRI